MQVRPALCLEAQLKQSDKHIAELERQTRAKDDLLDKVKRELDESCVREQGLRAVTSHEASWPNAKSSVILPAQASHVMLFWPWEVQRRKRGGLARLQRVLRVLEGLFAVLTQSGHSMTCFV